MVSNRNNLLMQIMGVFCDLGMIFGPCAGYIVQIRKMYNEKIC